MAVVLAIAYTQSLSVTYNAEKSILRYLSLTSEEQYRLHDYRLAALEAGLKQCASIKQRPLSITNGRSHESSRSLKFSANSH